MNLKSSFSKFLVNKNLLNVIFILSFLSMMYYLINFKLTSAVIFVIIGFSIKFFTNNMIIILGIPLILVNLMEMFNKKKEGMNTYNNDVNNMDNNKKNIDTQSNNMEKKTPQGLPRTKIDSDVTLNSTLDSDATTGPGDGMGESFEVGRAKRRGGYNIDYASTIEEAYENLNEMLGSDGIKKLTDDTQKLVKQQAQLAQNMNNMKPLIQGITPLLEQAKGAMGGIDGNNA